MNSNPYLPIVHMRVRDNVQRVKTGVIRIV